MKRNSGRNLNGADLGECDSVHRINIIMYATESDEKNKQTNEKLATNKISLHLHSIKNWFDINYFGRVSICLPCHEHIQAKTACIFLIYFLLIKRESKVQQLVHE